MANLLSRQINLALLAASAALLLVPGSLPAGAQEPPAPPASHGFGPHAPRTSALGITGQDLSGQLGKYFGAPDGGAVLIASVEANSPAAKAGLQAGDVITKVDSNRVRSLRELRAQLRENREAKNVTLSVLRKGSEMSVSVEPRRGRAPGEAPSIPL